MPMSWVGLLTLMVDGPDRPMRGVIRIGDVGGRLWSVWRDDVRVRVEDDKGHPSLIGNRDTLWRFDTRRGEPVATPADAQRRWTGCPGLVQRRPVEDWIGTDFTRPTGPVGETEFLGRAAYTVELAPPAHKPFPIQMVVDAETGMVLQQRNDGGGRVDEWQEFVVGEAFDDELFTWRGPARSLGDEQAAHIVEWEREREAGRRWFADHVGPVPLPLELESDIVLHTCDDDGAFEASLGDIGLLTRRRHSNTSWKPSGIDHIAHRWSDEHWDWALDIYREARLTAKALARLQQRLGSQPN